MVFYNFLFYFFSSKVANIVQHSIGEVVNRFIAEKWPEYEPVFRQEVQNHFNLIMFLTLV